LVIAQPLDRRAGCDIPLAKQQNLANQALMMEKPAQND
jgi:hypothetical protein